MLFVSVFWLISFTFSSVCESLRYLQFISVQIILLNFVRSWGNTINLPWFDAANLRLRLSPGREIDSESSKDDHDLQRSSLL